jgi:FkbH-like protein
MLISLENAADQPRETQDPPAVPKPPSSPEVIDLPATVKLVIWDLDDTFWSGTLAEGAITPLPANSQIVKTLAERGIISSICSKNDHQAAQAALTELGIWDYFVFPKIEFGPKGQNIADIIETAGLRAENVLFIDDNILNLEEARHLSPGLMTADPQAILPILLDLPQLAGKDDRGLTRLRQYKTLQIKAADRAAASLGNEAFLRGCGITVDIDYDIESQFDRIIELANRTNQLNYTKQRLETPEAVESFRAQLATYGVTAGLIRVADKYGDYGIVGFFALRREAGINRLLHLVFSCRTMNMGIEQYIYQRLGRPDIDIVPPVANPIETFPKVNWITESAAGGPKLGAATSSKKLLLIGACELLQLASLCSSDREEFVNIVRNEAMVRYDDLGFILNDRKLLREDDALRQLDYWTFQDAIRFDRALASSQIVIASLFGAVSGLYFARPYGNFIRIFRLTMQRRMRDRGETWMRENFPALELGALMKFKLLARALNRIEKKTPPGCRRFAYGVNTKRIPAAAYLTKLGWPERLDAHDNLKSWLRELETVAPNCRSAALRHIYNAFLRDYCARRQNFTFVDIDRLTSEADIREPDSLTGKAPPDHLTRHGYVKIATFIAEQLAAPAPIAQIVEHA